jgi:glyoxylase-like metal-dependent hydrolase (beta-lactamase superfamily II)
LIPGWIPLGQYPVGDSDGVGSWILHHDGEAALLELPPDAQLIEDAAAVVASLGARVRFIFVSHDHEDHFNSEVLRQLRKHPVFTSAKWLPPATNAPDATCLDLSGEPLWRIPAPKHSRTDRVTVFRGFAMTGDIELGTLDSVDREVPLKVKRKSLALLASFEREHRYQITGLISAHLNDFRQNINWP